MIIVKMGGEIMKNLVDLINGNIFFEIAMYAGGIIRDNFLNTNDFDWKEDDTPVGRVDKIINNFVLRSIGDPFPDVSIIAEEGNRMIPEAQYQVICDPLDGTIPYMAGVPFFAFAISLLKDGAVIASVIYDPLLGRVWKAVKGEGTFFSINGDNPQKVRVSSHNDLHKTVIAAPSWHKAPYDISSLATALRVRGSKCIDPAAIALFGGLIASGFMQASILPSVFGWETAAMQLIVEEAGGKATDINGEPIIYGLEGGIKGHIISNGFFHDELVQIVRDCQKK